MSIRRPLLWARIGVSAYLTRRRFFAHSLYKSRSVFFNRPLPLKGTPMHNATALENREEQPFTATHRVRIDCAYDGSLFSGWAAQPNLVTVQGVIENALELILRAPHRVVVAGRTDAGVHAEAQTLHCDLNDEDLDSPARPKRGRTTRRLPGAPPHRRSSALSLRCGRAVELAEECPRYSAGRYSDSPRESKFLFDLMRASRLPVAATYIALQMARRTVLILCTVPTPGRYLSTWIVLILTSRRSSYSACVIFSPSASRVRRDHDS